MKRIQSLMFAFLLMTGESSAQGPLTPPEPPAPGMKTLQEIWDAAAVLETRITSTRSRIAAAREQGQLLTGLVAKTMLTLPWSIVRVDEPGNVGAYPSLAIGPDGHPAISYTDTTNASLKFARFDGTAWICETVDTIGGAGVGATSLAFGPDGRPAISYLDADVSELRLARHNGGSWIVEIVDGFGNTGFGNCLSFGPDGFPAISYSYYNDFPDNGIKFARFNGSTWNIQIVDGNNTLVMLTSMRFGPDGQPAIAYQHPASGNLRISRYNGSSWIPTIVHSADEVGLYVSLAFDSIGEPSIAYQADSGKDLNLASIHSGNWIREIVDTADSIGIPIGTTLGKGTSLAYGPDGYPSITYLVNSNTLKTARLDEGYNWKFGIIESGTTLNGTSLAFGRDGLPSVVYQTSGLGNLKIARKQLFRPAP